jgi:hypothetical protein
MNEKRNTRVSFSKVNPTDTSNFDEFWKFVFIIERKQY